MQGPLKQCNQRPNAWKLQNQMALEASHSGVNVSTPNPSRMIFHFCKSNPEWWLLTFLFLEKHLSKTWLIMQAYQIAETKWNLSWGSNNMDATYLSKKNSKSHYLVINQISKIITIKKQSLFFLKVSDHQ